MFRLKMPSVSAPENYRRSLDLSWKEGIPAAIMTVITDFYFIPLALFLGATPFQIGLMVAIPHFLGSAAQLSAVHIVRVLKSRLKFLIWSARGQTVLLSLIALLPLAGFSYRIPVLIFLIAGFRILNNLTNTVGGSLASEYLTETERGRYFGWRSRVTAVAGIAGMAAGGLILFFGKKTVPAAGFFLLFMFTAAARFKSATLIAKMQDIPLLESPKTNFTFRQFVVRFRESNFVKFVLFVTAITFSTNLAAPFFSVHMLKNLHFSYLQYMTIHMGAVIAGLISFPVWGRHADHIGNARVLWLTSWMIPLFPLLWIITRSWFLLIAVEIFAGFAWSGFNLCAANFIYDAVTPEKRIRCLSYFGLLTGIAIFAGASLGGFLAERIPAIFGYRLYTLFLISGMARFASHFFLSRSFREVRPNVVRASSAQLFFSVLGVRPMFGRTRNIQNPAGNTV